MAEGLEAAAGVAEGQILAGKYRVERVLGVGGMGVVIAARHVELDEKVAIKFLLPTMLADTNAVVRFSREAKAAVRIKSEHVARVFDVGRLENGAPYMVMEFLEGNDLAAWLARSGPLPVAQAVDFVLQACIGVADAHALGIVHRDLKPANLFCVRRSDGRPSIKVLDFGISKMTDAAGSGMSFTHTSAMMGSPLYMSPAQFRSSKNVDARTDIWALGAILFELVTGEPPFRAETVPELAIKIATEPPPRADSLRPNVPRGLATVVAQCLEREPERRHRDVAALALALAPFAASEAQPLALRVAGILGQSAQSGIPSAPTPEVSHAEARTASPLQYTSPEAPNRSRLALTIALLGGLIVAGGAGISWWRASSVVPASSADSVTALAPPPAAPEPAASSIRPSSLAPSVSAEASALPAPSMSAPAALVEPREAPAKARPPAPRPAAKAKRPSTVSDSAKTATPTRPSCDPPFYFDAKGNRVFKQECL
jgi:eukaryotic-like serine/threonine-protein kinase